MGMHKSGRNDSVTPGASVELSQKANDIGRRGDQDKTLADYIARKQESDALFYSILPKKLTFEEWMESRGWMDEEFSRIFNYMKACWKAAQENA